jgi:hypothetical protein
MAPECIDQHRSLAAPATRVPDAASGPIAAQRSLLTAQVGRWLFPIR